HLFLQFTCIFTHHRHGYFLSLYHQRMLQQYQVRIRWLIDQDVCNDGKAAKETVFPLNFYDQSGEETEDGS
ncbi:hypothetical protein ABEV74_19270, partial [Paenibacillus cisolokensis]|uniref:hypothetical protein n=1 Tax=Paenibacillus cisolokensis TaxID=1658519 RepID=UPI003D27762B